MQLAVAYTYARKTFADGHPRAGHAGYMATIAGIIVNIVQVETGCAEIKFIGFFLIADFIGQNAVNTGR